MPSKVRHFRKAFENMKGEHERLTFSCSVGTEYENFIEKQIILPRLEKMSTNLKVLDMGTGSGRWTKEMAVRGHETIGVDISKSMIRHTASRLNRLGYANATDLILCNIENLPFKEYTFDLVLCIRTIKYASEPVTVIQEVYRTMKRHGVFIVSFPNLLTYYALLVLSSKISGLNEKTAKFFTLKEIKKSLEESNFSIEDVSSTLRLPRTLYLKANGYLSLHILHVIEHRLSRLLPKYILPRSFIVTAMKGDNNQQ